MKSSFPLRRGVQTKILELDRLLDRAYHAPEEILGNKENALDEAIYIILSLQTDLARASATWARLRSRFPEWEDVERASLQKVAQVLRAGGLHRQKARTIKALLSKVRSLTGELSLEFLRGMTVDVTERFLTSLPGISWKVARCVLLYSLNKDVLPVDVNTFRILRRAGILSPHAVYRRRSLHDAIQQAVPVHRRRRLHINLVVHGQRTCLPLRPKCSECVVRGTCRMLGVPPEIRGLAHRSCKV